MSNKTRERDKVQDSSSWPPIKMETNDEDSERRRRGRTRGGAASRPRSESREMDNQEVEEKRGQGKRIGKIEGRPPLLLLVSLLIMSLEGLSLLSNHSKFIKQAHCLLPMAPQSSFAAAPKMSGQQQSSGKFLGRI